MDYPIIIVEYIMETEITINDLARTLDEVIEHIDMSSNKGWSTQSVVVFLIVSALIVIGIFMIIINFRDNKKTIKENKNSIGNLEKDISIIKTDIGKITSSIEHMEFLKKFVSLFFRDDGIDLTTMNSPITLNERGIELSKKIHAETIINNNYRQFINKVCLDDGINAYDIQQNCFEFSKEIIKEKDYFQDEEYKNMKNIAFEEGVTIESLHIIFGILLRDKILDDKNLTHSDIDKHERKQE